MTRSPIGALGLALLLATTAEAQRKPDFSGNWVLVEALVNGSTRGSGQPSDKGLPTKSTTVSGAPVNCGTACTITHKADTLTIAHAQLADYPGTDKSQPTPAVTLHLNGRPLEVVDSFSPQRQIPVVARSDGAGVRVESRNQMVALVQKLRLENSQLVIISSPTVNGEARYQTTFRYRRK